MWCYTLFPVILNMSLTAGLVIIFVLLARLPLKKAPKVFSYALWAVVLFRLLCPISFSSGFSILSIFNSPTVTNGSITYIPNNIVHMSNPKVDLPLPGISRAINGALPQGEEQTVADPLEAPMAIATFLWLMGTVAMLVYSIVSVMILKKRLKIARCMDRNIFEADNLKTPFVLGIFRPGIYIPTGLTEEEKVYIIRHEQTHIRRLDHIIKPLAFLVLSIHWFNPLVWIAFVVMSTDLELSCDERVIKEMGSGIKKAYSKSLLSLAAQKHIINGSPLAFGEGNVKGRIKNVLNYKKPAFWIIAAAVIAIVVLCTGLLANPEQKPPLSEIAEKIEFSMYEGAQGGYTLNILNKSQNDISSCSMEIYNKRRMEEGSKSIFTRKNFRIKSKSNAVIEVNLDFDEDQYVRFQCHRGLRLKSNRLTIEGALSALCNPLSDSSTFTTGGTGEGAQGLIPYAAQQTSLEPITAKWSPQQKVDAVGMAELDYASEDIVIFHGYFGLFVYDLKSHEIIRSLDLGPLNCTAIQGDDYCDVSVSKDGNTVRLHRMSSNNMYVYTVSSNTLRETPYERISDRFGSSFISIADVVDSNQLGLYSYNAVKFDTGEFAYLHTSDWTLGTFTYVRGDKIYKLFDIKES